MELIAPKDPQQMRDSFYLLLDQPVGGIPQPDGAGRHPIYLNDDRLTTFAKMVGGVTDPAILSLLTTAAGFRRLVHSIGVSLTAAQPTLPVRFTYRCRGAGADGGGSAHSLLLTADGSEQLLPLAGLAWQSGDTVPGEFLFELPRVDDLAVATVKLYLNDGYHAPAIDPDPPVDFESEAYRAMIARSFLSGGDNRRVQRVLQRIRAGQEVTIAFLGGSITQGAGAVPLQQRCYARRTFEGICQAYAPDGGKHLHYRKAGVGGTPSQLGGIRYERDITRDGACPPDLVVLEFAVNDTGDETQGVCYESLVRTILRVPQRPALILLFAVFSNDWNLKDRLAPIGWRYALPMVDLREAVSPQFTPQAASGRQPLPRVITKRQYFYDVFHPSNRGHRVMADSLLYLLDRLDRQPAMADTAQAEWPVPPVYGDTYTGIRLLDRGFLPAGAVVSPGSFTGTDTALQSVPLDDDTANTPEFPLNWQKQNGSAPFVLELTCAKLQLVYKDSGSKTFGAAAVRVDGEYLKTCDPLAAGWDHCHATLLFAGEQPARHRVEIAMAPGSEDKTFTILGFGWV